MQALSMHPGGLCGARSGRGSGAGRCVILARAPATAGVLPVRSPSQPSSSPACVVLTKPSLANKPRLTYAGAFASEGMNPEKAQLNEQLADAHLRPPNISKTDDDFAALGLEFVHSKDGIALTELNDLFEKVGFPRRDPEKLKVALENTYHLIWIRSTKQSRLARLGQLVGFGRATSDGVLSATIWDVAVAPAWQRSGLGRALMERLTARLVQDGIPTITLYAEPNVVGLYEKLGFMKDPEGIRGMAFQRRKKERQPALARR